MSYEGYEEYICSNGHYNTENNFSDNKICTCGANYLWFHVVDQTNGYDPDDVNTYAAEVVEIGWDDIRNTDHYGNVYYTKHLKYKPDSPEWLNLNDINSVRTF